MEKNAMQRLMKDIKFLFAFARIPLQYVLLKSNHRARL